MSTTQLQVIGGPLDGIVVPNTDGYFKEGDKEAVNSLEYCVPGSDWSPESVYQVVDGNLVYDPEATKEHNKP